jgi:hypothetical protein
MNVGTMAYFIEYASQESTCQEVGEVFNKRFGAKVVDRVVGTINQDYKTFWKSYTIYFKDSCVDHLFSDGMAFHSFLDRYVIYYNDTDYWDVHLIPVST